MAREEHFQILPPTVGCEMFDMLAKHTTPDSVQQHQQRQQRQNKKQLSQDDEGSFGGLLVRIGDDGPGNLRPGVRGARRR
jgi:hypothetical protein